MTAGAVPAGAGRDGGCWWRGHNWGRWHDISVRIEAGNTVTRQERTCRRCGKSKWVRPW